MSGAPRSDLAELETVIGYCFHDKSLLERAIVHSSHGAEEGAANNERLEFLGDAVLDLAISELLMELHPGSTEGELTRLRASLVNTRALARVSRRLGIGDWMRLGKGEATSGGRDKHSILAGVYEAVLGALFTDGGYASCREAVARHFGDLLETAASSVADYKTALQELTQARAKVTPTYEVIDIAGPDHARHYQVELSIDGEPVARGEGPSRKRAEQAAAKRALAKLEDDRRGH